MLADRVDLVFVRHKKTPAAARKMADAARANDRPAFEAAYRSFVACASDEIRDPGWWGRSAR